MSETEGSDEIEITRLAALSPLAYEREREPAAERMGVRVSILDRLVTARRTAQAETDDYDESAFLLPSPEPWPEPVSGADLLTALAAEVRRYVVMEEGCPEAVALWTVHAHALDAFPISPRLAITSAEKRSGKTTLLDVLGCLVPRPLPTANATAPAIFRTIEAYRPTLLIDEADTFLRRNDELRGVLNSGHRKATARVLRLDGDDHQPRIFGTWAATVIAMIGKLPDTLHDRCIEIRLRRRLPDEPVTRFRADRPGDLARLARMAARWAADHQEALKAADPEIPRGVHDRMADNWAPLLAIADEAGGEWPERARQVLARMASQGEAADMGSVRELLLSDIRAAFSELQAGTLFQSFATKERIVDVDRIRSADLVRYLSQREGQPWAEWGPLRRPITTHALARLLKAFGIAPVTMRFNRRTKDGEVTSKPDKGYAQGQFEDAFARYLAAVDAPDQTVTSSQTEKT